MATPIPANRCPFTLDEVARATRGHLCGGGDALARGVSIDTRTLRAGELFVALRGPERDGHDYLAAAAQRGAAGALVARGRSRADLACVETDDTLVALADLARFHLLRTRAARSLSSIAIGGAAGKTTTKEMAAALAQTIFDSVLFTPGNLNNLIGVPMTIFMLSDAHRALVLECGTSVRGEIARLSAIVQPNVAAVLNVDLEHTEGLGTIEEVADEEASLFLHTRDVAVIPSDEPRLARRVPARLRRVTFGAGEDACVRIVGRSITSEGRAKISLRLAPELVGSAREELLEAAIALPGAAAALNCAAAVASIAAASPTRLTARDLRAIEAALAGLTPIAGRLAPKTIGPIVVLDDTYNANPRSVRAALVAAREIADAAGARLLVALGDMLELGALSDDAHRDAVKDVLAANPALFVAAGKEMGAALDAALRNGIAGATEAICAPDSVAAAELISSRVRTGDVLLVKGSRGIRMERVIEALSRRFPTPGSA